MRSIEICAGAGGQALGLEQAGFDHEVLIELDKDACNTLRANRPSWNVIEGDVKGFVANDYRGIDLVAGGVPCPPFSIAGKQLGADDERDLFPQALRLIRECKPRAVMLENVKGILQPKFYDYRNSITSELEKLGYKWWWKLVNASEYGVPQLRPRSILVAIQNEYADNFSWPEGNSDDVITVGEALFPLMSENGWKGAEEWSRKASKVAPTLVGGSRKHGGPDLGPTRSRKAWADLGVNGGSIAECAPDEDFDGVPRLTVRMAAKIQGFPDDWNFSGRKTAAYRQVGNAFPPPVAKAIGTAIKEALNGN